MKRAKMLTTTITRAAFSEKMKQVAEEGQFVEYKHINDYWKKRFEGVVFPTEMVFLVGSSPYRFTAVSVETVKLSALPEYAREIVSRTEGDGTIYRITCHPITGVRAPAKQSSFY